MWILRKKKLLINSSVNLPKTWEKRPIWGCAKPSEVRTIQAFQYIFLRQKFFLEGRGVKNGKNLVYMNTIMQFNSRVFIKIKKNVSFVLDLTEYRL